DELTSCGASLNQYKSRGVGADRQFYLSAWAGEPARVHGKNQERGPVFVSHPSSPSSVGCPPTCCPGAGGEARQRRLVRPPAVDLPRPRAGRRRGVEVRRRGRGGGVGRGCRKPLGVTGRARGGGGAGPPGRPPD